MTSSSGSSNAPKRPSGVSRLPAVNRPPATSSRRVSSTSSCRSGLSTSGQYFAARPSASDMLTQSISPALSNSSRSLRAEPDNGPVPMLMTLEPLLLARWGVWFGSSSVVPFKVTWTLRRVVLSQDGKRMVDAAREVHDLGSQRQPRPAQSFDGRWLADRRPRHSRVGRCRLQRRLHRWWLGDWRGRELDVATLGG